MQLVKVSRSGMDDYGWIENDYGDVVWEMNYRDTEDAGGAFRKIDYLMVPLILFRQVHVTF